METYCKNAERVNNYLIKCKLNNYSCSFCRMCAEKNKVLLTSGALTCLGRNKTLEK